MGFGKAFGFSLLAYAGLNFLFVIISETLNDTLNLLFQAITANPEIIVMLMFGPIALFPMEVYLGLVGFIMGPIDIGAIILYVGYIVAPFLAALIAGKTGGTKGGSFGGWFLTAVLSGAAVLIVAYISPAIPVDTNYIIALVISSVTNGLLYGCFALLFTKTEYY